ncbi:MAG: hypothetical protein AB7J34_17700 [Limisphaerales bacterium]
MFWKAGLVLAVVLIGIPAGYLTFEHYRGKRRLAATIARLQSQGERLDIDLISPPPAAPATDLAPLIQVAAQLEDGGRLSPPAMRCIQPARAIPSPRLTNWASIPNREIGWTQVEEWAEASEPDLKELHKALAQPGLRASLDYSKGFQMLLTHLAPLKSVANALSTSAAFAARQDNPDRAIADLKAIGRATAVLGDEPIAISQLVRIAMVAIALNRSWDILHGGAWNDAQLQRLDAALPDDDLVGAMVTALEGERAIALTTMRQMSPKEMAELLDGFPGLGGAPGPAAMPTTLDDLLEFTGELVANLAGFIRNRVILPFWRFAFNDHAIAAYLDVMQEVIDASRKTHQERRLPTPANAVDPGALAASRPASGPIDAITRVYVKSSVPALSGMLTKAFAADIQRTLLRTDIALHRYKLRHGRYPESLDALVPEFLPAVPIDAADGQPIRYRFTPDQPDEPEPLLWSAGENGVDDGGDPEIKGGNLASTFHWWRGKDAVWPRPASPAETAAWLEKEEQSRKRHRRPEGSPQFQMSPELMKRYGLIPATADSPTNPPAPAPTPSPAP